VDLEALHLLEQDVELAPRLHPCRKISRFQEHLETVIVRLLDSEEVDVGLAVHGLWTLLSGT
jgi:hypothetical protein